MRAIDWRGATMLEFAIVGPTFVLFLFAVLGVGLDSFYQHLLDDAVRDATRQIKLAAPASASGSGFVSAVCAEFGILAASCQANLTYNVQAGTTPSSFSSLSLQPLSSSGTFPNAFFAGNPFGPGVPVLVQVAYPLPFALPYIGSVITWTSTNSIVATSAVLVEPYQ